MTLYDDKTGDRSRGQAERVHLAEYATRANVPAKLAMRAHEVGVAAERGRWSEVKAQAEIDVVTTALLLGRHLYATGEVAGGALGTDAAIAGAVIRTHAHRAFADDLRRWLDGRTAAAMRQAWADHSIMAA